MVQATHSFPHQAVTVERGFWSATASGENLFSVRGGIPLTDAFEQLSLLLAQAKAVVAEAGSEESVLSLELPHAGARMLDFSHALVDAMHIGLIEHEAAIEGLAVATDPITP
jgi:hypothetical protein